MKQLLKLYIQQLLSVIILVLTVVEYNYGQQSTFGKIHNLVPEAYLTPHASKSIKTKDVSGNNNGYIIVGYADPAPRTSDIITEYDIYLLKINNDGNVEWQRTIGEPNKIETAYAIDQTSDGGYIIVGNIGKGEGAGGSDSENLFLIKTNSTGILEWYKTYERMGGALCDDNSSSSGLNRYTQGSSVKETREIQQQMGQAVTNTGQPNGYIITGYTGCQYGNRYNQAYVMRTDINGTLQWTKIIYDDIFQSDLLGCDASGHVALQTNDGSFIVAAAIGYDKIKVGRNIALIKYDLNGSKNSELLLAGTNSTDQRFTSMQQTSDGGFILAGIVDGKYGILIKTGNDLTVKWAKEIKTRDGKPITLGSVTETADGGFVVGGTIDPYTVYATAFLFKANNLGTQEWVNIRGCNFARGNQPPDVFTTADGGFAMIGVYDWSSGTYIMKTDNLGNLTENCGDCGPQTSPLLLDYNDWSYNMPRVSIIDDGLTNFNNFIVDINATDGFNNKVIKNIVWNASSTIKCENIIKPTCQTNLNIIIDANTVFDTNPKEFHAGNSVTTSGIVTIPSGNNVQFKAVNHVQLNQGFTASAVSNPNTIFKAELAPCPGTTSSKSSGSDNAQSNYNEKQDSLNNNIDALGQVKIYPNPANYKIYIESNDQIERVNLFDISGSLKNSLHLNRQNDSKSEMYIDKLPSGVYIIELINKDSGRSYHKLLKQ